MKYIFGFITTRIFRYNIYLNYILSRKCIDIFYRMWAFIYDRQIYMITIITARQISADDFNFPMNIKTRGSYLDNVFCVCKRRICRLLFGNIMKHTSFNVHHYDC